MKTIFRGAVCALIMIALILLSACSSKPDTLSFEAMDTVMSLTVYGGGDVAKELKGEIEKLDGLLDTTDENSEINRLNSEGSAAVGDETAELLKSSLELCGRLDGSFDITIYPAVLEWGFITGEYKIPDDDKLSELSERTDWKNAVVNGNEVTLKNGATLDLGAVAKGYAADRCRDILSGSEARAAVLNLGGTICLFGEKPDGSRFRVGIADPENPAGYFGYIDCGECVISTSGGYERYFEKDGKRYIHILDPDTAKPVDNGVLSVTVISADGACADALSTALFVMGADKAAEFYKNGFRDAGGEDFIILTDSGELYVTDGVYGDLTLAEGYDFEIIKVE